MQEDTKISDLTVAEFRQLMQQCFERDRAFQANQREAERQANPHHSAMAGGNPYNNFGAPYGGSLLGD